MNLLRYVIIMMMVMLVFLFILQIKDIGEVLDRNKINLTDSCLWDGKFSCFFHSSETGTNGKM